MARVAVASPTITTGTGITTQFSSQAFDGSGRALLDRPVTWSSGNNAIATVSPAGKVTGVAAGTVTISATSEGKTGTATLTVTAIPAQTILTGVRNATTFLDKCGQTDPAYATILNDFRILNELRPFTGTITCTEPYSALATSQLSEELLAIQTLRLAYYMSIGTEGKLPWTPLSFYDWIKSQVAGINITATQTFSNCCATIEGKKYFTVARRTQETLGQYRDIVGLENWLGLVAHEVRHAAGYPHVTGCPAFPLPTDAAGCDATYDEANLGAYGIQEWLFSRLATGALNVGLACGSPAQAQSSATTFAGFANGQSSRFVVGAPAVLAAPVPYGGICYPE